MYKERTATITAGGVALDFCLALVSFLAAHRTRIFLAGNPNALGPLSQYVWFFFVFLILTLAANYFHGFYTFGRTMTRGEILIQTIKSSVVVLLILVLVIFVFKIHSMSRFFVVLFSLFYASSAIVAKLLVKSLSDGLRKRGYNQQNALVIGTGRQARYLIENLSARPELGYKVVGCVEVDSTRVGQEVKGVPILGALDELHELLLKFQVDEVFFAMPLRLVDQVENLIWACEEIGIRFSLMTDFLQPSIAKTSLRYFLGVPILTFSTTPSQVGQLLIKSFMDRVLAAVGLVVLMPLFLLISLAIKITSSGPVLFKQKRSGLNGRIFTFYKFRSMVADAEEIKESLEEQNEMSGPVFKIKDDPRVTAVGKILRRMSLDELPQLYNVLIGDMSLVGPRPPIPEEVEKYERRQRRRLSMRPGITCIWQTAGRNAIGFDQWMALDLKYIDNWSLKLDFVLLAKTIPVVLSGRGAS